MEFRMKVTSISEIIAYTPIQPTSLHSAIHLRLPPTAN